MIEARKFKYFLFKVREDLKRLFFYPDPDWGEKGTIDYDKYWAKRRPVAGLAGLSSWQKQRADLILPFLKEGDTVVDIGGGQGEMLEYWMDKKAIKAFCVDFNSLALDQAHSRGIEAVNVNLNNKDEWALIPVCDFLTGFEILEHLPNPEEFILGIAPKVRKGLFFSFPNTGYYLHRLRLLLGRFPLQWVVHPGEHLRFWTVVDTTFWVKSLGLRLEKIIVYEGLPFLNKIWPALFGQGIIIYIKKDE